METFRFFSVINEITKCPLNFGIASIIAERIAHVRS